MRKTAVCAGVYVVGLRLRDDVTLTALNHKRTLFLQYLFPWHFFHAEFVSFSRIRFNRQGGFMGKSYYILKRCLCFGEI